MWLEPVTERILCHNVSVQIICLHTDKHFSTLQYHKMISMVVVGFPVVFFILIVVQILTECVISEFPPFAIVDIFTLSSKVLWVKYMIHKFSGQHIVARQRKIISVNH